jgi:hypothetical protein
MHGPVCTSLQSDLRLFELLLQLTHDRIPTYIIVRTTLYSFPRVEASSRAEGKVTLGYDRQDVDAIQNKRG